MPLEPLRAVVHELQKSASALAALGAALDASVSGIALDPQLHPHVHEVLAALGVDDVDAANPVDACALLGEIRVFALTNVKLLFAASCRAGWEHAEPELLEAAGEVSRAFPHALQRGIAPQLEGLVERLAQPDAAFLDVGVGVGVLSVEMARLWPSLRVVGIDPLGAALALADARVRGAGLERRIELRHQAGEALADERVFDLAWVPSVFLPESVIPEVLRRVRHALRPGGWLLFPMTQTGSDALSSALARLRTRLFGGLLSQPAIVEERLREQGFELIRCLPSAPGALTAVVVGRRPPA